MTLKKYQYVIGDIHGCYNELLLLEEKIKAHAKKENANYLIISVGDLVDRGPDSKKVVEHFLEGSLSKTHLSIIGNHEQEMLLILAEFRPDLFIKAKCKLPSYLTSIKSNYTNGKRSAKYLNFEDYRTYYRLNWVGQGGSCTLESFGGDPSKASTWKISPKTLTYLCKLPLIWKNKNIIVTHALANEKEIKSALYYEKTGKFEDSLLNITWGREKPSQCPDENRMHISGHSIVSKVKRHKKINCIQIDTGCFSGKSLTAYCPQTDKIISQNYIT